MTLNLAHSAMRLGPLHIWLVRRYYSQSSQGLVVKHSAQDEVICRNSLRYGSQNLLSDRMRPVVLFLYTSQAAITVPSFLRSAYSPSRYLKRRLYSCMRPVTHCTVNPRQTERGGRTDWAGPRRDVRRCARSRYATQSPLGKWVRLKSFSRMAH